MSCGIFKVPGVGRARGANGHTRVESRRDVTGQCADLCGEHRCGVFSWSADHWLNAACPSPALFHRLPIRTGQPLPLLAPPGRNFSLFCPADADFMDRPGDAAVHSKSVATVFDMCALGGDAASLVQDETRECRIGPRRKFYSQALGKLGQLGTAPGPVVALIEPLKQFLPWLWVVILVMQVPDGELRDTVDLDALCAKLKWACLDAVRCNPMSPRPLGRGQRARNEVSSASVSRERNKKTGIRLSAAQNASACGAALPGRFRDRPFAGRRRRPQFRARQARRSDAG